MNLRLPILILSCIIYSSAANAQTKTISGNVYDATKRTPLEAVSVITTKGLGTITDSLGYYHISLTEKDTLYFSYLGKGTNKFAVKDITTPHQFDISLQVTVNELPTVTIKTRNYILDSLQNRKDYEKAFNYKKPRLETTSEGNLSVTSIINLFRKKKMRQMMSLQKRLVDQEQDKYIDKRYSKRLVLKLTGLKDSTLENFMRTYRPGYHYVLSLNDLELGLYIQNCYKHYTLIQQGVQTPNPVRLSQLYERYFQEEEED